MLEAWDYFRDQYPQIEDIAGKDGYDDLQEAAAELNELVERVLGS